MKFRISSRQSPLAKIQAYQVGAALQKANPEIEIEYFFRESLGDQNLNEPLWKIPEKGVFTEDFHRDLVQGHTDMVVHSWKDLPTEEKEATFIAATLPRADQRDLLLFKKSSFQRPAIRIFSSSPRRTVNVKEFLPEVFPWKLDSVEFTSVRGNISTRVQKMLENPEVDGLIVAKAALDRLLTDEKFPEAIHFLRTALQSLEWMVLPLSENPNAAAQGALAIEIHRDNRSLMNELAKINCSQSYKCAQREREILKEFGGGCHLAIGASVLERPLGRIEIVKGLTPSGDRVQSKKWIPRKKRPSDLTVSRMEFESTREANERLDLVPMEAAFVSRAEAWRPGLQARWLWAAGLKTWKKLAAKGVWVHGSAEGLGESEEARIDVLCGRPPQWRMLTHEGAAESDDASRTGVYKLNLKLKDQNKDQNWDQLQNQNSSLAWQWKSGSEFLLAFEKFPILAKHFHICGPGRSFEQIKNALGSDEKIFVELNDGFITVV